MLPNIGAPELIIILVIALLILGPGKLPEVGASLGKSIKEFRKASSDIQESVNVNVDTTPLPPTPANPTPPAQDAMTASTTPPPPSGDVSGSAAPASSSTPTAPNPPSAPTASSDQTTVAS